MATKNPNGFTFKRIREIQNNIGASLQTIQIESQKAAYKAATQIWNSADLHKPKIPLDKGLLRASWTVRPLPAMIFGQIGVRMGFMASYAEAVHEMERYRKNIRWSRAHSGSYFFVRALRREQSRVLDLIAKEVNNALK